MITPTQRKAYNKRRKKTIKKDDDIKIDFKLLISLIIILLILLMKKYDYSMGNLNIDTIYNVVYDSEDFDRIYETFSIAD